jgi:predicted transcriptional regulator
VQFIENLLQKLLNNVVALVNEVGDDVAASLNTNAQLMMREAQNHLKRLQTVTEAALIEGKESKITLLSVFCAEVAQALMNA